MDYEQIIIDMFENYGYIEIERYIDSDNDEEWFIDQLKKRYVISVESVGNDVNGNPIYRLEGPHEAVFNVLKKYWNNGLDSDAMEMEFESDWKHI